MKASEIDYNNAGEALEHVAEFLRNCPQYDGSELSANLLFERISRQGRQFTADELESTFNELANEGLINGSDNPATDLLEPVVDVREYHPPETDEIEITFYPEEDEVSREEIEALSMKQIGDLLKQHDAQSAPPKSIDEELAGLSTAQLGQLIVRASKR